MREALQRVDEAIEALRRAGQSAASYEVASLECVRRSLQEALYGAPEAAYATH